MLYKKNHGDKIDKELFKNPTAEYRGTPFWAWNCKLEKEQLKRQIDCFKEMGFGGFHMHPRTGLATEYLSDEFMDMVDTCVKKAEDEDMLAWLYDEDRYPSGAAGGIVTKNPKYRQRKLLFTVNPIENCASIENSVENGEPAFLACYDVELDADGFISDYRRIDAAETVKGTKWYAYMTTVECKAWFNGQAYIDTLDESSVQEFIRVTYERYAEKEGEKFGEVIPAIFTDEPQFGRKQTFKFPHDKNDVSLPWTPKMQASYREEYGEDILDYIPELFWDLKNGAVSVHRYRYHDHLTNLFVKNFAAQCGAWCGEHKLCLTGHLMEEPTLWSQTSMVGDAMRSYPHFQIPGIDMLCGYFELTTAKQVQSIVRQNKKEAMLSELYGVTHWDFDFRGHKIHGDWQAALGVTVRVPHLSLVSMEGEAKRDYPASISYQSPWYKEYSYVENHFARVNTAMTRGKAQVRVGVIHPIESYWLHWGPTVTTADIRNQMDERFQSLTRWLLTGCIDFDFICEAALPQQCPKASVPLKVGEMEYDAVIVPACETLRSTTLERLQDFSAKGGRLIFLGKQPEYIDGIKSDTADGLYRASEHIEYERNGILAALNSLRDLDIRNANGERTDNLIYQMRNDNDCKWLFAAHCTESSNKDIAAECPQDIKITIKGEYKPVLWNTTEGTTEELPYFTENGNTVIGKRIYDHDSLLIQLNKADGAKEYHAKGEKSKIFETILRSRVKYTRSEMNPLLLDMAKYSLDGEPMNMAEEVLRIDNKCRQRLGYPDKIKTRGENKQPWVLEPEVLTHNLTLEFTINSDIDVDTAYLAIERPQEAEITFNGAEVKTDICGYYVDESIKTIPLCNIKKGENTLRVSMPYGERTCPEWCYVLGDFDVLTDGMYTRITDKSDEIVFSDISSQGLAFYGGNLLYETDIELPSGDVEVHVPHYRGAVIKVLLDGRDCGMIAYAPYNLMIKNVSAGIHKLEFVLYGNRFNTFGSLHDAENGHWAGPSLWLTSGDRWTYGYMLRKTGILSSPVVRVYK